MALPFVVAIWLRPARFSQTGLILKISPVLRLTIV